MYEVASIFSLKDNFTANLKNIIGQQKNFKKETQVLTQQLNMLYDKQRTLKVDTKTAGSNLKKTLREAQKEFEKTGKNSDEMKKKIHEAVSKKVKLQFDSSSANREVKNFEKNLKSVGSEIDKVNRKKINPQTSSSVSGTSIFKTALGVAGGIGIFNAVTGAVKGVVNAGISALNIAGQMEQTQMAYETMLKSQIAGQQMMTDLKKFAINTPFEFMELSKTTQYAMAMGFKQKDMISLLTDVGDAAAGTGRGAEGVDNIVRALGQMQQKGKVSAQEINQLAENGIGAWGYISNAIGKTTAETMKLAENGLIPADKAIQAIRKGLRQDYGGMMGKQSKTLLGMLSNVKDFVNLNILGSFGEGIRQGILPSFSRFTDMLTKNGDGMKKFQQQIENIGKSIGDFLGTNADKLMKYFDGLFSNKRFQEADFGGKIKIVLNDMYVSMKGWLDGEGGKKIKETFTNMAKGAMQILIDAATVFIPQFAQLGLQIGGAMVSGITSGIGDTVVKKADKKWLESKSLDEKFALDKGSTIGRWKMFGGISSDEFKKSKDYEIAKSYFDRQIKNGFKTKEQLLKENPWAKGVIPGYAFGKNRVPYNNFPALLHEGEKVLTKQEANKRQGISLSIAKLADQVIIREESDIGKLARQFALEVYKCSINTGGG